MHQPHVIVLPFASPSQNQLDRWHWTKKRRLRDECCLRFEAWMRRRGIDKDALPRVRRRVHVVRYGARTLDYGNLVGGFKPILDALRMQGMLVDDCPRWVEERYEQCPRGGMVVGDHDVGPRGECTVVTITDIEPPAHEDGG